MSMTGQCVGEECPAAFDLTAAEKTASESAPALNTETTLGESRA
jgi:hypothetical protein